MTAPIELPTRLCVGQGQLTWPSRERRTDRYGMVGLQAGADAATAAGLAPDADVALTYPLRRSTGRLVAEVVATRDSLHIGDLFRGLTPSRPSVGEFLELGHGVWLRDGWADWDLIGVFPPDGRSHDWLDPKQLYRAHSQTVRLWFVEDGCGE